MAGSNLKSFHVADTFMLRAPVLPLKVLSEISSDGLDSILKKYYSDEIVQEALFLASPQLHNLCLKWLQGDIGEIKNLNKLKYTLLKYLTRMASRCTPFGLFAGICSGNFSNCDQVMISDKKKHKVFARPDMHYLCNISNQIIRNKSLRPHLTYFTNNSLYPLCDGYRYIEYHTDSGGSRKYQLQQIHRTDELDQILDHLSEGASLSFLVNHISGGEISREEASEFLNELIDNQVIVSDIEPVVSGQQYLDVLYEKLGEFNDIHPFVAEICSLKRLFDQINNAKTNKRKTFYKDLIDSVRKKHPDIPENILIQADMKLDAKSVKLNAGLKKDLLDVLLILMKLARLPVDSNLSKFRQAFVSRYGQAEIPLMTALDPEAGPGYLPGDRLAHSSELLEKISISYKEKTIQEMVWSEKDSLLMTKLHHALISGSDQIEINLEDIDDIDISGQKYPASFSMIARIFGFSEEDGQQHQMQLVSVGGPSALNISGRFSHMDTPILSCMKEIAEKEQMLYKDSILAEIVHLPEQRTGNILIRPSFRNFEIPYLATAGVDDKHSIPASDLMLSVQNSSFRIRSQSLNKDIIPRMANAHNFSIGSLAVYRFLCDMQMQNLTGGIGFSWGPMGNIIPYLPRVTYRSFILHAATWNLFKNDLSGLLAADHDDDLLREMNELREKFKIPSRVILQEGDNELWLDLENVLFIRLLCREIMDCKHVILQEFISENESSVVRGTEGTYANEFVFYFYQDDKK